MERWKILTLHNFLANKANAADAKGRAKHTLCNKKELNERQLQLYMAGNV